MKNKWFKFFKIVFFIWLHVFYLNSLQLTDPNGSNEKFITKHFIQSTELQKIKISNMLQ